jgi:CRP-like cAMP-binding protein
MTKVSQMFAPYVAGRLSTLPKFREALEKLSELGFVAEFYPAHSMVFDQGVSQNRLSIVESGWGCLSTYLADGQRQVIDFPLKGDLIAEHVPGKASLASFTAITDMRLLAAPLQSVTNGDGQSTKLLSALLDAVSRRSTIFHQHLTNLGRRSALKRTAHLLLELHARLEMVSQQDDKGYACPLTQYDLADALGLTPIHVNRMLRELRERELLEFRHGHVHFMNRQGLVEFADFDADYLKM